MDAASCCELAHVLRSLSASNDPATSLAVHVARQLHSSPAAGKPLLAQVLAEILNQEPEIDLAENLLRDYLWDLISTDLNDLTPEQCFTQKAKGSVSALILAALGAHVSSDEAFEVDIRPFIEKHAPVIILHTNGGNAESLQNLQAKVSMQLRFLRILLLEIGPAHDFLSKCISADLAKFLLSLVALRNVPIAEQSCQVLRLLLTKCSAETCRSVSEMVWDSLQILLGASVHIDLAFSIWLCWVSRACIPQEIYEQHIYWTLLQTGLATGFSERKKYCLHILMSSLPLIERPIKTRTFSYNPNQLPTLEMAWTKYSTLIEIVSLSTSANQLRAALPEIRRLLGPKSSIGSTWMVILISLGLRDGGGPLQKVIWESLGCLSAQELHVLFQGEEGREFLTEVLLPYVVTAHHFVVKQKTPEICEHGDFLSRFLERVISSGVDTDLKAKAVLKFLDQRGDTVFSPASAYVLKGLLKAVKGLEFFDTEDLKAITSVAGTRRTTEMKTAMCTEMCLDLLISIDRNTIGISEFINKLCVIISGKEHMLSAERMHGISEYLSNYIEDKSEFEGVLRLELETALHPIYSEPSLRDVQRIFIILYVWISKTGQQFGYLDRIFTPKINLPMKSKVSLISLLLKNVSFGKRFLDTSAIHELLSSVIETAIICNPRDFDFEGYATEFRVLLYGVGIIEHEFRTVIIEREVKIKLFNVAWERQASLMNDDNFDSVVSKSRAELLAICQYCISSTPLESTPLFEPDAILQLIRRFPLPILGANAHDNAEKTKSAGAFLSSAFGLLAKSTSAWPHNLQNLFNLEEALDTTLGLVRFLENESLLSVLDFLGGMSYPFKSSLSKYTGLGPLIAQLWDCVDATRHGTNPTKVYVGFIQKIFNKNIIEASLENGEISYALSRISQNILKLASKKRSVLPAFANALHDVFTGSPDNFCRCLWLIDMLVEFINLAPNKDLDFLLETPLAQVYDNMYSGATLKNHYESYHGCKEIFAQASIFHIFSRMDPHSHIQSVFGVQIARIIFQPWTMNKPGMPIYSSWKRTSQLQTLLLLERFIPTEECGSFLESAIWSLHHEPHPKYRFLFEWIIAMRIIRFPEHRNFLWPYLQNPKIPSPKLQASLLRVSIMVARELGEELKEIFYTELIYTVVPLISNNKVVVRHQAIAMVLELWDDCVSFGFNSLTENVLFERVRGSIINSNYYREVSAELTKERTFDVMHNYTMIGIFSGNYLNAGGGDEAEMIPPDVFLHLENIHPNCPKLHIPTGNPKDAAQSSYKIVFTKTEEAALILDQAPLQTKSGTWDAKTLIASADHHHQESHKSASSSSSDQEPEIIIIASLIENPYNLGGLSRVSEIMGVKTLCLHSKDILKSTDFISVSVHSESWLPILELQAKDIISYIRSKKLEGYKTVGIEQTDRSVILGHEGVGFERKTVLVLGREKTGIPPEVLVELDCCVEIAQRGETRSMNVQTAAAVALFEIRRQFQ